MVSAEQVYHEVWKDLSDFIPKDSEGRLWRIFALTTGGALKLTMGYDPSLPHDDPSAHQLGLVFNELPTQSDLILTDNPRPLISANLYQPKPEGRLLDMEVRRGPRFDHKEHVAVLGDLGLKPVLVDLGQGEHKLDPAFARGVFSGLPERLKDLPHLHVT